MAGVEFRILGPLEVLHEGRAVPVGGSRERAVLALLLASANRVVSAERLADELWPAAPPEGAGHSLQVFVSRLRKGLRAAGGDGVIVTRPPGYLVEVEPERLDAARFESLVASARRQAERGAAAEAATTLQEALALWRGPALADLPDSPLARSEAARLEEARLAATEARIDADLACGRHAELVAELEALTRGHPLRERLWGQRMVALYRAGRQVEALRAFQDVRRLLAEEVGLEPGRELAALEAAVLRQAPQLGWQPPGPSPTPSATAGAVAVPSTGPPVGFPARTPFVGREWERAELGRLLDGAGAGGGALVLVGGEPGVGKTRLTAEMASDAAARGFRVLVGRCYETEGAPPYVAFAEILDEALAGAPSAGAFRSLLGDDAPEVAKLLPRLRRLFPDIPPPLELPPEQERYYLFNSLRDVFARAAAIRPLFLVVDDLHWADEGTLLLLEHLAERLPRLPVLVVATYRDTEVTPEHRLARPLESLLRERRATRLTLPPLSEDGVAALLRALSGQEPPPSLVAAVHSETQGNPFFTEEVFKHLVEEGRLFTEEGRFRPEVAIGELDVPESLRLVLGRRLQRLGDDGRRGLAAAAVVGRAFTYELLEALGELPPDALLDVLDEAGRARLVAPLSDAPGEDRLLFSHELIRQTLLAELSQPRRRRLHLRVADTLERLYADSLDGQASEIAHHLTQAGSAADRRRLLRFLSLAGRQAMRTAGYEDALRHFEQAVSLADLAEPVERPGLYADRARARRSLGDYAGALPDWEEALQGYEALDDLDAATRMRFEISLDLWWLNRDAEALQWAERALAALGAEATPRRGRILAWTGAAGAWVTPYEHGAALIDEALAVAERLGDKRLSGYALVNKALHRIAFSLHREVLDAGREGIRLLQAEGDLWEVATLLAFMEVAALELGEIALSVELGERAETLGTRIGHSFAVYVLHDVACAARRLMAETDLDALQRAGQRHFDAVGDQGFRHHSKTLLAHAAFLRGDWEQALVEAEDAVAHSPEHHATSGMDWACYLRVLAYSGRSADVHAVLERCQDDLPRLGRPNGLGPWYLPAGAVEALTVIGDRAGAAAFYPVVREFMATTGVVVTGFCSYLPERIAGIGATVAGQWEAAEGHFRTALRQADELPFVLECAETKRWFAQLLLERSFAGDVDQARSLLEQAIAVYRRIGMPRHEALARAVLPG